ncbi:unnamed protein product [Ilex paraguariensis]|uniref:THIF-type NAD/FAD binding fold domain-containing protein n=1 Tax=Ilex paraguariensis TaxID=185542 RepID=A0ABC8URE0_9AQUA
MGNEELTEQETALYDRQIRVWGVDAQRRLSKSHILVSGLRGTVVEFCKNIVLAGVGSLTLNDDRPDAIAIPWRSLPKRVSKLYFAMRVLERFEEAEGRNPGETSTADLPIVLKLRKDLCEAHSPSEAQIPDSLLERLLASTTEFPPVCAIIGGILGQEVIKAISGKGDPLKNFFFFDAVDGKGIIEDISNTNTHS